MSSSFVLVNADDWEGIYRDGLLVWEHHRADFDTLKHYGVIGDNVTKRWLDAAGMEATQRDGGFPPTLTELDDPAWLAEEDFEDEFESRAGVGE